MKMDLKKKILFASLDDYPPLFEILWEIDSLEVDQSSLLNQYNAANILYELTEKKYVSLYTSKGFEGNLLPIDNTEEIKKILHNPDSWLTKGYDEVMVRAGITQLGESLLNQTDGEKCT